MRKITLLFFAAFLGISTALAVPAKKVKKQMLRADGTSVEVTLCGDEHFSFYKDEAGLPYTLNGVGRLQPTTDQLVAETWENMRVSRLQRAGISHSPAKSPRKVGEPHTTVGKVRGLVLLVQFPDVPFVTENPKAVFNRFFNEKNYNEYGMSHSVTDYFSMQSYGKLEIDFDVVGPFTTKHEMAYYGAPSGSANDVNPAGMVSEAIDAAAPEVDFTPYDWDEDGEVDQVFVIYAGYNQAQGAESNTIWPHEWNLDAAGLRKNYNDKIIRTYGCTSELRGDGKRNTGILDGIGTACHEFSHCLGLPDMYDTGNAGNFGMNTWDIMDYGSYNGDNCVPAGYTAYERMFSGWLTPVELNTMTTITDMKPLATTPEAYILYNEANKDEYYLLENRQPVDFDKGLYGHGLLIVHVDYNSASWSSNSVNVSADRQRMTIIPADNKKTMELRGLAGDPWPGSTGNTALSDYTTPAAELNTPNSNGTYLMGKAIDNINENVSAMTVSFVACRPPLDIPTPDDGKQVGENAAFTVTWPAVKNAVKYELELTEIGTASTDPKESLVRDFNFDEFYSKSVGMTDVSSKLGNYGLGGWTGSKLFTSPNKVRFGTSSTPGSLQSPFWYVPQSTEFTIVMSVDIVKASPVNGTLTIEYANSGDSYSQIETIISNFSIEGKQMLVFNYTVRKELFRLTISPMAQMSLDYLAIYDGTWSAEQLGLSGANSSGMAQVAAIKGAGAKTFSTTENSFTFADLNLKSRYYYRVRAIGEAGDVSGWSDEKMFVFSSDDIVSIPATPTRGKTMVYDSMGRLIYTAPSNTFRISDIPTSGLLIIRDDKGARKVMR